MDTLSDEQRQRMQKATNEYFNRLRVTRELSKKQYNRLKRYESVNGVQTVDQIAKMFRLAVE